jgi:hypothetical protein
MPLPFCGIDARALFLIAVVQLRAFVEDLD